MFFIFGQVNIKELFFEKELNGKLKIEGVEVLKVNEFKYLGSTTQNNRVHAGWTR